MSAYPAWMEEMALSVARRFTQDTEPQRRANLQLAVSQAMAFAADAERRELLARQSNMPEADRKAAQARLSELEREYGIAGTAQARLTDLFFGEGFRMGGLARQVPDLRLAILATFAYEVMSCVYADDAPDAAEDVLRSTGLMSLESIVQLSEPPTGATPTLADQYSKPDRAPGEDGYRG